MPKPKKRPSKTAKAALKALSDSKLLATKRAEHVSQDAQEFKSTGPTPRTSGANKKRPNKKRG